ncbi:unnamed protein product [Cuscuta europaea]|uniref:Uncharacterized protein n=1 Tax=Cuscuta europaea TaxID=41803 RepID=A0A9P1E5S9_CUSEU|nr:unnamed protein product [Cuscuta europaea]
MENERKTIPLVPGPHSEERNAKILSFPVEDRVYVNLVSDSQEDSGQGSEASKDDGEGTSAFVPLQVVFPVVTNNPMLPIKNATPTAATSSSTSRFVPSDHELLAMDSRRKRIPSKLPVTPLKVPKYPVPNAANTSSIPTVEHRIDAGAPSHAMHLSFSPEFCSLKDAFVMKNEMAQLQLASSAHAFDYMPPTSVIAVASAYAFQSIQASLVAAARVASLEKTFDELKKREASLVSRLDEDAKLVQELEANSSTLSAQILQLEARVKSLDAYGRKKKQEVINAACYYAWKTRGS